MKRLSIIAIAAVLVLALCAAQRPEPVTTRFVTRNTAGQAARFTHVNLQGVASAVEPRTSPNPPKPVHHAFGGTTRSAPASPAPAPIQHTRAPSPPIHSGGLHGLVCSYGWSCAIASCVISHESGWNTHAFNPSGAAGLMQLMPIWYRDHWNFDPFNGPLNIHYGHELYLMYGWSPWHGDPCV